MNSSWNETILRWALLIGSLFALSTTANAQQQVIPVWPGVAPGSESWTRKEVDYSSPQKEAMVRNVVQPTLTVYQPTPGTANGTAVIVCPGGGFLFLSWENEGTAVAQWLSQHGVTAFVLKYRLEDSGATDEQFQQNVKDLMAFLTRARGSGATPSATPPYMPSGDIPPGAQAILPLAIADGLQALKVVRQRASEWGITPDRIGIMGFSAGAYVTTGAIVGYGTENRPSFAASIYGNTVDASRIPADAPPLFVLCASDDPLLPATGSANLYSIWRTAGHSAELHIYTKGGHGFGMHKRNLPIDHWIDRFGEWLDAQGLLTPAH